jgi:hypothetical protein
LGNLDHETKTFKEAEKVLDQIRATKKIMDQLKPALRGNVAEIPIDESGLKRIEKAKDFFEEIYKAIPDAKGKIFDNYDPKDMDDDPLHSPKWLNFKLDVPSTSL